MAMVGAPVKPTIPPTPVPPQKPRPATPAREGGGKRNGRPSMVLRVIISVIIVWHFAGVFLAALQVPATSRLVFLLSQRPPMQWYLDALNLNHAHSFFAPDVGPGHVIHYELYDQANHMLSDGTLPNKKEHWPRLLYHRYMMLADQAEVPSDDKQEHDKFQRMFLEAYARQLLRLNHDAASVRVQRFAHWPIPLAYARMDRKKGYALLMQDFSRQGEGHQINEQGYELIGEAIQRRSDLGPEAAPPEQNTNTSQDLNWQSEPISVARRWSGGRR
jgi:hypothetical protein